MHARKDRRIDHLYRLRCTECEAERFAELGGDSQNRAEAGEDVDVRCGKCRKIRGHEVVAP